MSNKPQHFKSLKDPALWDLIKAGALGVIPTDTVYGLVCRAADEKAVERLFNIKPRDKKPGTLIASTTDDYLKIGITPPADELTAKFWPGPVSVEAKHSVEYLHRGTGRQALRLPEGDDLRSLLAAVGALQTTSANHPEQPVATTIHQAENYFGDEIDFYVDGGDFSDRPPSTIIGIDELGRIVVYRQGVYHFDDEDLK